MPITKVTRHAMPPGRGRPASPKVSVTQATPDAPPPRPGMPGMQQAFKKGGKVKKFKKGGKAC